MTGTRKATVRVIGDSMTTAIKAAKNAEFGLLAETANPMVELRAEPTPRYAGVAKQLDRAVAAINDAKRRNDELQRQYAVGSPSWHACETIDDHLHEALAALGD